MCGSYEVNYTTINCQSVGREPGGGEQGQEQVAAGGEAGGGHQDDAQEAQVTPDRHLRPPDRGPGPRGRGWGRGGRPGGGRGGQQVNSNIVHDKV